MEAALAVRARAVMAGKALAVLPSPVCATECSVARMEAALQRTVFAYAVMDIRVLHARSHRQHPLPQRHHDHLPLHTLRQLDLHVQSCSVLTGTSE